MRGGAEGRAGWGGAECRQLPVIIHWDKEPYDCPTLRSSSSPLLVLRLGRFTCPRSRCSGGLEIHSRSPALAALRNQISFTFRLCWAWSGVPTRGSWGQLFCDWCFKRAKLRSDTDGD